MNKSLVVIIVVVVFFSVRYYVQKSNETQPVSYEQIQYNLDNIKNAHKYR